MTEVLSIQTQSAGTSHFGSAPLRRSSSSTSFLLQNAASYSRSSSNAKSAYNHTTYDTRTSSSLPSSAPSSPRVAQPDFSNLPSCTSTPSSSLSLDEQCESEPDDILFPSYNDDSQYEEFGDAGTLLSSTSSASTKPSEASKTVQSTSQLPLPDPPETQALGGDDSAVKKEPSRHVDYLSHNWVEEDIWSSWRHIVAKRKVYSNAPRLENASWRTWAKSKDGLKTVSPEKLNWMKDHDVTWLYGPLQTPAKTIHADSAPPASQLSRSNSFATKKPILKKRSLSEIMLQRSLSSSTLMRQATDALRAQQPLQVILNRPLLGSRAVSDFTMPSSPTTPAGSSSNEPPSALASRSSSGRETPCERRHIHFNDKVEQCIAINKEGDDHSDYCSSAIHDDADDDDSSDDGIIMMRSVNTKERKLSNRSNKSTPRGSFSNESKTIAMLPSTTLKYRGDTPEPPDEKSKKTGSFWSVASSKPSPSPSQETLKPSQPSSNFLLDEEDDDADMSWQPTSPNNRRDTVFSHQNHMSSPTSEDFDEELRNNGMRRTPSGMFMPYEEDEDDVVAAGLFGKVVDTVNTAKDIAHVIWNVGWRR